LTCLSVAQASANGRHVKMAPVPQAATCVASKKRGNKRTRSLMLLAWCDSCCVLTLAQAGMPVLLNTNAQPDLRLLLSRGTACRARRRYDCEHAMRARCRTPGEFDSAMMPARTEGRTDQANVAVRSMATLY
jgi:hypothetical protein